MAATRIGCDNLVYALLITDDGATLSFGTPKALPGVMKLNINPNPSQETLFADDGPSDTATTLGKIEVEIDKSALATDEKAVMLGHTLDAKGALIYGSNDTPPWLALGFRTLKSNGTYRYVWMYKGKFMEPEDNNETKGDSINFQNDTIKGMFAKINKEYTVNGRKIKPWKSEIDEETPGVDQSTIDTWFSKVYVPTDGTLAGTLTVAVASGTALGTTKATITGTATTEFAIGIGSASLGTVFKGATPIINIKPYVSGADIAGVAAGKYLYVYDLDAQGKVVKFYEKLLAAGDVKTT